jgi:hypothetical protein
VEEDMLMRLVDVMQVLPLSSRNVLESSGLLQRVEQLATATVGEKVVERLEAVLEKWHALPEAYRIKRIQVRLLYLLALRCLISFWALVGCGHQGAHQSVGAIEWEWTQPVLQWE